MNLVEEIKKLLGREEKKVASEALEEVKELMEQGTEEGVFEESERQMVDKIFYLSDQTVYGLMTPRLQIKWLDMNDGLEQNLKVIRENSQNIFLAGRGSLDEIIGVIYVKDILNAVLDKNIELEKLIKKPVYIPRTMEIFRVIEKFKNTNQTAAVVNDEYGGVTGFITIEDISKEILLLRGSEKFISQNNNSWVIEGLCSIEEFKRKFELESLLNEERDHFKTMGGFVTSLFGYIPKVGEKVDWNNFSFEVLKMDGARVEKLKIKRI